MIGATSSRRHPAPRHPVDEEVHELRNLRVRVLVRAAQRVGVERVEVGDLRAHRDELIGSVCLDADDAGGGHVKLAVRARLFHQLGEAAEHDDLLGRQPADELLQSVRMVVEELTERRPSS